MVETKAKARHQRKSPKGKGVRKSKREKENGRDQGEGLASEKGSQRKGCREAKREKSMVETKAKARRLRKVPEGKGVGKQSEKRER